MARPPPDLHVDSFLPYMRDVLRCEGSLRELNLTWRMIEASAKINCPQESRSILPMMTATRVGFERLEKDLVTSLVNERVAHVLDEVGTKAAHAVDIIVRNLYERTADVGFLATDRDLCDFVAGVRGDADTVRARLRAYRDKYTVYDDILLLDTEGRVLVHLDEAQPVQHSQHPLVAQALGSGSFVEAFGACDLRPSRRSALIYARRMDSGGRPVGVLCLSFQFDDEMQGIFRSRRDPEGRAVMLLLDGANRVIASADEAWIPLGTEVPVNTTRQPRLVLLAGREYLVQTWRPAGYQGYPGPPGWQGQVMIPVNVAFTGQRSQALDQLDGDMAAGLLAHARQFCPPLFEIVSAAQAIRRVVWNGQVMTASQRGDLQKLKSILEQISDTGARTNALFSQAIRDLYDTVLGSAMRRGEFLARLLVDLLDRNLYERSDDCRWWALTPELRQALAETAASGRPLDAARVAELDEILAGIHRLYTVYTRLVVYDLQGRIVAGTVPTLADGSPLLGQTIPAEDLAAVRALASAQDYHVSAFGPSPLDDGRPTYVYHAAIRDPQAGQKVVGGIGIVFNSTDEFSAMLRGSLPEGGASQALFVNRQGQVLAGTDPQRPVGHRMSLPADWLALAAGEGASRVVVHDGQYAVMSASVNFGYREFKTSDGYREDVIALVIEPLGAVLDHTDSVERGTELAIDSDLAGQPGREYATFFLDGQLHALPADQVVEALPGSQIAAVSLGRTDHRLGTLPMVDANGQTRYVWAFDLLGLVTGRNTPDPAQHTVIVVRVAGQLLGLLVGRLHGVPEFLPRQLVPLPLADAAAGRGAVREVIEANAGQLLIPVLDLQALCAGWLDGLG